MKPIEYSGQAIIEQDKMERNRAIASVLEYDLKKRDDLTPEHRAAVEATIERYREAANVIEAALNIYKGINP